VAVPTTRVLVTGASRGLGLSFVRGYLGRGARVFATVRGTAVSGGLADLWAAYPDRLSVVPLDVTDPDSLRAAHSAVLTETDGLDVLINNAAMYSAGGSSHPTERLGGLDPDDAMAVLRANAVGPLVVTQRFLDLLQVGIRPRVVSISSDLAIVGNNDSGEFPYYYSASKAALNMYMRSVAVDVRPLGIVAVLLDPGWMQTEMGDPEAPRAPDEAADAAIKTIDALSIEDTNRFVLWDGSGQNW
jgi:NAD(P)-dependent dehydrogenase (short-subunit alcohol dehydrogenase family)